MDTTMMSDVGDYFNMLPDMVDRMDIEDSSFMQLNVSAKDLNESGGNRAVVDQSVIEEQSKKIKELEAQLEEKSTLLQNTTVVKE